MRPVKIAPSLIAADFRNLESAVRAAEDAGADLLHLDVMDGHFVPNLTFGPMVVEAVRSLTRLPLDVHLMVDDPERFVPDFARAGADGITVHVEATRHLYRVLQGIRAAGCRAGVAFNPATPLDALDFVEEVLDLVLVLSVNPGFSGQAFLPSALTKLRQLSRRKEAAKATWVIEVDGGINADTAGPAVTAGAEVLVAGTAVFGQADVAAAVARLRQAAFSPRPAQGI
ncbi:MAG: ribulose-phosphate 3-epimerase [Clostridia bacterium]|nr:ribulose-phosphate 3-epimerase [Clostridia bacterium]